MTRCLRSVLNSDIQSSFAAKHRAREPSACIVAGSDPRSPEGDLARKQAGEMGSLPAMKRFLPRTVFVRVPSCVPWSTSLSFPLIRTGCRTRYRTILGNSRSAIHIGFASKNAVVTGQEMGSKPPFGAVWCVPKRASGPVPPSFLRLISSVPMPRIHRSKAGCRNVKGRGRPP